MAIITATATDVWSTYSADGTREEAVVFTGAIDGHPAEMDVPPPELTTNDIHPLARPLDYLAYVTEVFEHFYCEDHEELGVVDCDERTGCTHPANEDELRRAIFGKREE